MVNSGVWINRVRLMMLLRENGIFPCPRSRLIMWSSVSQHGFGLPAPRQPYVLLLPSYDRLRFIAELHLGSTPCTFASVWVYLHGGYCVCVCFLPIHSGHQVRWTYQPGSHRRKVIFNPPSFCGACLDFCREKDSAIPFPLCLGVPAWRLL